MSVQRDTSVASSPSDIPWIESGPEDENGLTQSPLDTPFPCIPQYSITRKDAFGPNFQGIDFEHVRIVRDWIARNGEEVHGENTVDCDPGGGNTDPPPILP